MNALTTLSEKGQVVIPKDVRDALGFATGQKLEVTPSGNGVFLRPVQQKSGRSADEIFARLREIAPSWQGKAVSIEEMDHAVDAMVGQRSRDDI